ncbi:transposase [Kitasatospora sp. NPDC057500]|uniref:transposase n=1 Tax=Kitasatospora sp. NPDC057500 TaxID=3346151 RepID=UPI0036CC812A
MSKRYTAEFRRDAVALVRSSPHRNATEIARELGVGPEGLRRLGQAGPHRPGRGRFRRADRPRARGTHPASPPEPGAAEDHRDPAQGGRPFRGRDDTVIRFRFVEDHHGAWGVKRICRVLGITRSSFHAWRAGGPRASSPPRSQ